MSIETDTKFISPRHRRHRIAVASTALALMVLLTGPSVAQVTEREDGTKEVDFCSGVTGAVCYTVEIKNVSSATVQSTDFDQNSTDGACSKKSIKVKENYTGNNSMPNNSIGPYIYAKFNAKCTYEVKYNVTSGCTGDTRARVKHGKKPKRISLDKNCGTLKTIKKY